MERKQFTSLSEIDSGIAKLRRRIEEIKFLDPNAMRHDDQEVRNTENRTASTIEEVFGRNSPEYRNNGRVDFKYGPLYTGITQQVLQHQFAVGLPRAVKMVEGLIQTLDEKRADFVDNVGQGEIRSSLSNLDLHPSIELQTLHSEIKTKCAELFEKGVYPEAVEKGFKVVRDKLRKLTGFETGSEAFGKGGLHIKGAAAVNVEGDFNEAVKFLTMAIDRFRNEKSHTSDARIDDSLRAYEYLRLSSLAMSLLDNAEIKKR